jgi:hypothetical protein
MKKVLLPAVLGLGMGMMLLAQDEAEYPAWMKTISATASSLRTKLEAKSPDAAADARKLEEAFTQVHSFWQQRNVADATDFAMKAKTGFGQVAQLAAEGKFEEASAAMREAQSNCMGCHQAHRERAPDGSWKIK